MPLNDDDRTPPKLRIQFLSDPLKVRESLERSRAQWSDWGYSGDFCGTAEIVLAEALNNVVEHAHARRDDGTGLLVNAPQNDGVRFEICDNGAPMPEGAVPTAKAANLNTEIDALPEGGFGWYLIHSLTQDLDYQRDEEWNCLSFRVPMQS